MSADIVGDLRRAEAALSRVRALADEWRSAAESARRSATRAEDLPTRHQHNRAANDYGYTAARLRAALDGPQ